jgi:hypothetical protein
MSDRHTVVHVHSPARASARKRAYTRPAQAPAHDAQHRPGSERKVMP